MRPSVHDVKKIWNWTQDDIENLFKGFFVNRSPGEYGVGPTNGYAIFLVSLMDIWGAIFRSRFGKNEARQNIKELLKRFNEKYPTLYGYESNDQEKIADILRNNLVHNYGLRILSSGKIEDWLNIDVNSPGPIINLQDNGRWHMDCMRLKNHLLIIIKDWLKTNNYI